MQSHSATGTVDIQSAPPTHPGAVQQWLAWLAGWCFCPSRPVEDAGSLSAYFKFGLVINLYASHVMPMCHLLDKCTFPSYYFIWFLSLSIQSLVYATIPNELSPDWLVMLMSSPHLTFISFLFQPHCSHYHFTKNRSNLK